MKTYIRASSNEALPEIVEIKLLDGSQRDDVLLPGTFFLDAWDSNDDEIWIGVDCDNPSEYVLETALEGTLYSNSSLYEVLVQFTDRYDISFDFVRQIFKFARNYITR